MHLLSQGVLHKYHASRRLFFRHLSVELYPRNPIRSIPPRISFILPSLQTKFYLSQPQMSYVHRALRSYFDNISISDLSTLSSPLQSPEYASIMKVHPKFRSADQIILPSMPTPISSRIQFDQKSLKVALKRSIVSRRNITAHLSASFPNDLTAGKQDGDPFSIDRHLLLIQSMMAFPRDMGH